MFETVVDAGVAQMEYHEAAACRITDSARLAEVTDLDPALWTECPDGFAEDADWVVPWPVTEQIAIAAARCNPAPFLQVAEKDKAEHLYENDEARRLIEKARANEGAAPKQARPSPPQHAGDAMWRARALNAEARVKDAREISWQHGVIADLMGRIRGIDDANYPAQLTQRIQTENATLKQHARPLEADNRALAHKLSAARENARFLDRRLADLEVQHVDPTLSDPEEAP